MQYKGSYFLYDPSDEGLSLFNTAEFFCKVLFFFHVYQAGDHNPLRLRRARSMHRFRQIPHGGRTHGNVFDEPQDTHPVFRGDIGFGAAIFIQKSAYILRPEVSLRGKGYQKTTGTILRQTGNLIGKPSYILLVNIGKLCCQYSYVTRYSSFNSCMQFMGRNEGLRFGNYLNIRTEK